MIGMHLRIQSSRQRTRCSRPAKSCSAAPPCVLLPVGLLSLGADQKTSPAECSPELRPLRQENIQVLVMQ